MRTTYTIKSRGEVAIKVERTGTAAAGKFTITAAADVFEVLRRSLDAFLFDPPSVPVEEGFAHDVERLDVFDLLIHAWARWFNLKEGGEVLDVKASGDLPPPRSRLKPIEDQEW